MKRSRAAAPRLKHLAFFEMLVDVAEETPTHRAAIAGLLTLRLIDHWVLAGAVMVEPESASVRAVREAIMAIAANDPQRGVLLGVVNTMQTLREVDMQPVLPRLFAYAGLLEKRGMLELAADAYESVIRHGDGEYDGDVVIDSHMRLGYCRRMLGALQDAEDAYMAAGKVAKRLGEPARVLHARIGVAKVAWMRGDLPEADRLLMDVVQQSRARGFSKVEALALHDYSVVAQRRGDLHKAVCLAYEALCLTEAPGERDFILADLGAYFVLLERFDVARDALLIQEATATTSERRCYARINLLSLAARTSDRLTFEHYRRQLDGTALPSELHVNYLIESARGHRSFGDVRTAVELLTEARARAESFGLPRSVSEAEQMLLEVGRPLPTTASGGRPAATPDPTAHVARQLREMAAALAA